MISVRVEEPADIPEIRRVHRAAFAADPHGGRVEATIVDRLRAAKALTVSLVGVDDRDVIVGHVAFSPVRIEGAEWPWYGLGPVGVLPGVQRRGVGSTLIQQGLSELEATGAGGVVLVGEPSYYQRFGFVRDPSLVYSGAPPEYFLVRRFGDRDASGDVAYHQAFDINPDALS